MRVEKLWSGLVTLGWVVSLVSCDSPGKKSKLGEHLFSDSYTLANISITYQDEHGEKYSEFSGKYGEGFIGSSQGVAVHVRAEGERGENDHTACTWPLLSVTEPNKPMPQEPWIAVIKRGSCNFEIMVQNAFRANATAVLIYNDRDMTSLEKMKLSADSGRNMSAVFTYQWEGEKIARFVDNVLATPREIAVYVTSGG